MYKNKLLIAFEGIDGSGKSTHAERLCVKLIDMCFNAEYLKAKIRISNEFHLITEIERSVANWDEQCRMIKATLMAFERANYFWERFNLNNISEILILDRYKYLTPIYMDYRGIDRRFPEMFLNILPHPDLIFYFDISPMEAIDRLSQRKRIDKHENLECLSYMDLKLKQLFSTMDNVVYIQSNDKIEKNAETVFNKTLELIQGKQISFKKYHK